MRQLSQSAVVAVGVCLLGVLHGCGGGRDDARIGADSATAISHEPTGGTKGFFFLPPIAPDPGPASRFDANLASDLKVEVFLLDASGAPQGTPVATFADSASGGQTEAIRVDPLAAHYIVNFHTDQYALLNGSVYRIFVARRSDGAEYGFADVQVFPTGKSAKSLVSGDTFGLVNGRTLPVKFRIAEGTLRPAAGRIAFHSDQDGTWQIHSVGPDGSQLLQLTSGSVNLFYPSWSPDGLRLAVVGAPPGTANSEDIHTLNADGSGLTNLTGGVGRNLFPAWSPDGSKIAFSSDRDGNWEIYTMDTDGSNLVRLTAHPARDWIPDWSPDGRRIAFGSDRTGGEDIYVMDSVDGSGLQQLTEHAALDSFPEWSPDGSLIAFASERDGAQNQECEIYVMAPDGSNEKRVTTRAGYDHWPTWSPDGKRIAFDSYGDGNGEIYVIDVDGTGEARLTDRSAQDLAPCWSRR